MVKPFWLDSGYRGVQADRDGCRHARRRRVHPRRGRREARGPRSGWAAFHALWVARIGPGALEPDLGWAAALAGTPVSLMYGAAVVEQFTGGMGTAAFLTFLMTPRARRYAATQFALLTALYRLGGDCGRRVCRVRSPNGWATRTISSSPSVSHSLLSPCIPWIRRSPPRAD